VRLFAQAPSDTSESETRRPEGLAGFLVKTRCLEGFYLQRVGIPEDGDPPVRGVELDAPGESPDEVTALAAWTMRQDVEACFFFPCIIIVAVPGVFSRSAPMGVITSLVR
jgi:hypothetical protein